MKKILVLGLTTTVIALSSLTASAASDSQYPASDFQPKVIYIDKEAVKPSASNTCTCASQAASQAQEVEFDPNYPAANFQPKIVYP